MNTYIVKLMSLETGVSASNFANNPDKTEEVQADHYTENPADQLIFFTGKGQATKKVATFASRTWISVKLKNQ